MKILIAICSILLCNISTLKANEALFNKTFNKKAILSLADAYVNNNMNIENPALVDVDNDGDFDILKFINGRVEYYINDGSLEKPYFVLENKNFDNYEINSFIPTYIPIPIFFADKDGDKDPDVFGIVKDESNYNVVYIENTMQLDHYTLITVILILVIVLLIVLIAR